MISRTERCRSSLSKVLFCALLLVVSATACDDDEAAPVPDPVPEPTPDPEVLYEFEVSNDVVVDYLGCGLDTFKITSRRTVTGESDTYPGFTFEFFPYDTLTAAYADVPDPDVTGTWLTSLTASSVPETPAQTSMKASFAPSRPVIRTYKMAMLDETLSRTEARGTADAPFDLSKYNAATRQTGARQTANCYVVTAPGWYMFPLVYGNALKGGRPDVVPSRYIVDAAGNPISESNYKCPADSVRLLWQDQPNRLVRAISLTTSDQPGDAELQFIKFYVDRFSIRQGNALIAATSGGGITWSWHIWVVDPDMLKTVSCTYSGWSSDGRPLYGSLERHDFMGVNLGWFGNTDADVTLNIYPQVLGKLRITQQESGLTREVMLRQNRYVDKHLAKYADGYCTFYQWGRKDPLAPKRCDGPNQSFGGAGYYRTLYDAEGQVIQIQYPTGIFNYETGKNRFELWAQNPVASYAGFPFDEAARDYDMWQAVKTVYDPCPSGFRVPATAEFAPIAHYIRNSGELYTYGTVYTDAVMSEGGNQLLLPCMTDYMPGGVSSGVGFGYWMSDLIDGQPSRYQNMAGGGYSCFNGELTATSYSFFPGNGPLGDVIRPVRE